MRLTICALVIAILANVPLLGHDADRHSFPSFFFRNTRVANSEIRFILETPELNAAFRPGSITYRIHGVDMRVQFVGSNPEARIEGADRMEGKINLLVGRDASAWKKNLAPYGKVIYRNLYPGIDAIYSTAEGRIKADFLVAPGADPSRILLRYADGGRVRIEDGGGLLVTNTEAELREAAPLIYQQTGSGRARIDGSYRLVDSATVGFEIGAYDSSKPLVIDPPVSYSTFLGGAGMGAVTGIAADSAGNAYLTGWTEALNFPIAAPVQGSSGGSVDAFVVKLSPSGTSLVYATYIGGRGDDRGAAIAVDASGQAYITGSTTSADFPHVSAIRPTLSGGRDAFAAKLNALGNALVYSTYLGGSNADQGTAIAVDSAGNAYLAGDTQSINFPVLNPYQASLAGQTNVFVTKLSPTGGIVFSTYLGGSSIDHAGGIAVDSANAVYVAGGTSSGNFPTFNAFQPASAGGQDAFITKMSPAGTSLVYSTFLGGSGGSPSMLEQANAIAVDSGRNGYITGATSSINFRTTAGALRATGNGMQDSFAAKIGPSGSLIYSTYLGGSTSNWASGIAVDSSGNAFIAGTTSSVDFPQVSGLRAFSGGYDAFISELNSAGTALTYSTVYGGSGYDAANAIAMNAQGAVYVGGQTNSFDLPLSNAFQSASGGFATGWVLCLGGAAPPPPPPPPTGSTDLALGKTATESSVLTPASLAVDGNTDGQFFDGHLASTGFDSNAWWQVDLGASTAISSVVVWNRTDCCGDRLSDYWVFISNTSFSAGDTPASLQGRAGTYSSHQTTAQSPSSTIPFAGVPGRYVRVQLSGTSYLSLAEVQVFGGTGTPPPSTNLAQGMAATESSVLTTASLAVDGNTDGQFFEGHLASTGFDSNAWWQVDLGSSATINSVVVWNRTDCCGDRLSDYWVFISNTPFSSSDTLATLQGRAGTISSHQTTAPSPSSTITFAGVSGRYVRVQLSGTNYLSLAEVQVFGSGGTPATNLAGSMPASESSMLTPASLAVDGNTGGQFFDGHLASSGFDSNAWWQVDLGSSATINSVVIWNRTDCCGERLSDYWVFISDLPFSSSDTPSTLQSRPGSYSSHQTTAPSPSTTIPFGAVPGRYVRVQLSGMNYLSLAEIQVFGNP